MGERYRETYEEQKGSEAEAEEDRACEVGVVHDVFVDSTEGIEDSERLGSDMRKVYSEFCAWRAQRETV